MPDDNEADREILYRLDERTKRIDKRIENVQERQTRTENNIVRNEAQIDENRTKTKRNTTIINALTFGLGSAVTAALAKFTQLVKFF